MTALSTSISINTFSETKELLTFYDLQTTSISFLPKRDIPEVKNRYCRMAFADYAA